MGGFHLKNNDIIGAFVAVLVIVMVIGAFPALVEVMNHDIDTRIGGSSDVEAASYIIYQEDGGYTIAKNGTTGRIVLRSVSTSDVINKTTELANGGVVYISSGTYTVNIDILRSAHIKGAGNNATILIRANQSLPVISSENVNNITLEHLTIDGTMSAAISAYSVRLRNSSDVLVQYCYFQNGGASRTLEVRDDDGAGNYLAEISRIRVLYNTFDQNKLNAIGSICAQEVEIIGNVVYGALDTGIEMSGGVGMHHAIISNNVLVGVKSGIITSELVYPAGAKISIVNNVIQNVTANGINSYGLVGYSNAGNVLISGNIINSQLTGTPYSGISIQYLPNSIVSNNLITGFTTGAIYARDSTKTTISGNQITASTGIGIRLTVNNSTISGNTINMAGSAFSGINIGGSYNSIIGNSLIGAGDAITISSGIKFNVINANTFISNRNGIILASCNNNTISNNVFLANVYNSEVVETGSANYNVIIFNHFPDSYAVTKLGANTIVYSNTGYLSEKSGTTTFVNGATTKVVNHGFGRAPTCVIAVGTTADTSAIWITSITTTQFTINVASGVTGTPTIYWCVYA